MTQFRILAVLLLVAALTEVQSDSAESRLLGSKDIERNSHTYHVALTRKYDLWPFAKDDYVGSGALISYKWLVTSARVATKLKAKFYTTKAKAGLERLQSDPVQFAYIEKVVIHEFYVGKDTDNDIALVKLKGRGLVLNQAVNVVSVATEEPSQNGQIVVTGWHAAGKYDKPLQEVTLQLKDRRSCGETLGDPDLVDGTLFCVENTASRAVCANDYGSPAVTVSGDQEVLVGIFTMTPEPGPTELCGTYPAVFTNVAYYNSWIGNNLN